MASKYLQQFPIPPEFPNILRDLTREILRLQPQDIIAFSAEYFKCKQAGKEFVWDEANPRAPRPCDYPKIIRKEPEKVKYSTKPGSEPKAASQVHQSHEGKSSSAPKNEEVAHEKKKSIGIESRDMGIQEKKAESKSHEKHARDVHHEEASEELKSHEKHARDVHHEEALEESKSHEKHSKAIHDEERSGAHHHENREIHHEEASVHHEETSGSHHQVTSETHEVITETRHVITETRHEIHIEHSEEHHHHETHQTIEETKEGYDSSVIPSLASPSEAAAKEYVEGLVDRVEKRISVQP